MTNLKIATLQDEILRLSNKNYAKDRYTHGRGVRCAVPSWSKVVFFSIKSTNLINVYVTCHRSDRFLFRASYNFTVTQVHVEYLNKRVNT